MGSHKLAFITFALMVVFSLGDPNTTKPDSVKFGYCSPTVSVPDTTYLNCSSCLNRCDEIKNYFGANEYCSCDANCVAYGDCCADFEQVCPEQFKESGSLRRHFKHRKTECFGISEVPFSEKNVFGLRKIVPSFTKYNFVAVCGQTGVVCNRTSPYELLEPNLAIPVTDTKTGVNYANYKCAKCNNVVMVTPWIPQLACDPIRVPFIQNETFRVDTEDKLHSYISSCRVNFMIPPNVKARPFCGGFTRKCSPECNRTDIISLCENSYVVDYVKPENGFGQTYNNLHCALCAGEKAESLTCAVIFRTSFGRSDGGRQFSLSLLFDFNPSEGVTVGRKACSVGYKWTPMSEECRKVVCPGDMRFVDNICLAGTLNITLSASLYFNFTQNLNAVTADLEGIQNIIDILTIQIKNELIMTDKITISLEQHRVSEHILNITLTINLLFNKNSSFNFGSDLESFSKASSQAFNDELVLLVQRSGVNLGYFSIVVNEEFVFSQPLLKDCTWFSFSQGEFVKHNDTIIINSTQQVYANERYRLVKKGVLVCIENQKTNDIRLDVSQALGILTLVLLTLSILCLTIRLVLQFKISYYSSFAGKLHFNLCLALCLAFLMLIIGGFVSVTAAKKLCIAFGILIYWFFLTAFFWMTAVTLDTWLVFKPSSTFVKVGDGNKSLIKYILPCWLIPAVVVIIVTSLDFADVDSRFQPKFGTNLCWFNQRYALLLYFGVPVALLTLLTTIFFVLTVLNLRKTTNSSVRRSSMKESHNIWIYFRLYVLMGVSWIFGFVAAFVGHDALWIIFIILNASQGILIFISFVLNRRVLNEMKGIRKTPSGTVTSISAELSSNSTNPNAHKALKKGQNVNSM